MISLTRRKKAVSPLIAVVLLMVVVIGVGAMVTNMVRGLVGEKKQEMTTYKDQSACSRDVQMRIITIDGDYQVCRGTNYVDIVMENTGGTAIDDFKLMIYGTSGFYTNDSWGGTEVSKGAAKEINMTFGTVSSSDIQEIRLIPKLKKSGETGYYYCNEAGLKLADIDLC